MDIQKVLYPVFGPDTGEELWKNLSSLNNEWKTTLHSLKQVSIVIATELMKVLDSHLMTKGKNFSKFLPSNSSIKFSLKILVLNRNYQKTFII